MVEAHYPQLQLHVDGEWLSAGPRPARPVVNPATGAVLGELPLATADDLDRALEAAERGYKVWKRSSVEDRGKVLRTAAGLLRERAERIARVATLEQSGRGCNQGLVS